jgi:hypothetical protein
MVLTDNDSEVVMAIINCPKGVDKTIAPQVLEAISEHFGAEKVEIKGTSNLSSFDYELVFTANSVEDDHKCTRDYTLTKTAIY